MPRPTDFLIPKYRVVCLSDACPATCIAAVPPEKPELPEADLLKEVNLRWPCRCDENARGQLQRWTGQCWEEVTADAKTD